MSEQTNGPNIVNTPRDPVHVMKGPNIRPVGVILKPEQLSEVERQILVDSYGWDGVSEVPSDLAQRLASNVVVVNNQTEFDEMASAAKDQLPTGFNYPTKDVDLSKRKVVELSQIPEALLKKWAAIANVTTDTPLADVVTETPRPQVNPAFAQFEEARRSGLQEIREEKEMRGLHPDVAGAIKGLQSQEPSVNPPSVAAPVDTPPKPAAAEPKKASTSEQPLKAKTNDELVQERFDKMKSSVTPEDRSQFLNALIDGVPFAKTYELLGGKVRVTFREPSPVDEDEVQMQITLDRELKRIPLDYAAVTDKITQYNVAVTLSKVQVQNQIRLELPQTPTSEFAKSYFEDIPMVQTDTSDKRDRPIRRWSQNLRQHVLTGSLNSLVTMSYHEFQETLMGLRLAAKDPDFFATPTS